MICPMKSISNKLCSRNVKLINGNKKTLRPKNVSSSSIFNITRCVYPTNNVNQEVEYIKNNVNVANLQVHIPYTPIPSHC